MQKKITNKLEKRRFILLLGMLAKIAKANGRILENEIKVVREFLEFYAFDEETLQVVSRGFNKLKNSDKTFIDFSKEYYSITPNSLNVYISILELMVNLISKEKMQLHPEEIKNLLAFRQIFNIPKIRYDIIIQIYFGKKTKYKSVYSAENDNVNLCYSILNCSPNDTMKEIKRKYRKLMNNSHPDKIIAKGLPEEFIAMATKRFLEIRRAYEIISNN